MLVFFKMLTVNLLFKWNIYNMPLVAIIYLLTLSNLQRRNQPFDYMFHEFDTHIN